DSNSSFVEPLSRLLAAEKKFEELLPELTKDFKNPEAFAEVYQFSFKLSLLRALGRQRNLLDRKTMELVRSRLSLSLKSLNQLMSGQVFDATHMQSSDPDLKFLNKL